MGFAVGAGKVIEKIEKDKGQEADELQKRRDLDVQRRLNEAQLRKIEEEERRKNGGA